MLSAIGTTLNGNRHTVWQLSLILRIFQSITPGDLPSPDWRLLVADPLYHGKRHPLSPQFLFPFLTGSLWSETASFWFL